MNEVQKKKWFPGKTKAIIMAAIVMLVAILSGSVVTNYTISPKNHVKTIASLDEKKKTILELTAASAGISAAITALPGDTGNTIAQKLADLSSYFLIVLCAIFIEKYLIVITGYVTFKILIPIACVLTMIWIFYRKDVLLRLAIKIMLFGLAMYFVVPMSVKISNLIETTYENSIETTIQSAEDSIKDIEGSTDTTEKKSGILSGIISKIKESATGITDKIGNILNNFIEALAVLIVTSCVIPVLVLWFYIWLIKMILGMENKWKSV